MAIIQISKIQQRSGDLVDLPQLDEAELGFASDAKRLFIGKENPAENIEVLTSYSNISFSQVEGAVGNLDIDPVTAADGQVLAFDGNNWVNRGGEAGGLLTLGTVSNVKIDGGSLGYVLETDGTGNLSWTTKGTISGFIKNITNDNPGVITTTEDNFFVNRSAITITNVLGMTELNGNTYYAKILTSNSFALYEDAGLANAIDTTSFTAFPYSTGNGSASGTNLITLANADPFSVNDPIVFSGNTDVSNSDIISNTVYYIKAVTSNTTITVSDILYANGNAGPTKSVGTATFTNVEAYSPGGRCLSPAGGGSSTTAGGAYNTIQFNNSGLLDGNPNFAYNNSTSIMSLTGTANIVNVNISNSIVSPQFTSNVANGTAPLVVNSQTVVANLNADLLDGYNTSVLANVSTVAVRDMSGNLRAVNFTTTGNVIASDLVVNNSANIGNLFTTVISTGANTTSGTITGNWSLSAGSQLTATYADLAEYYAADANYIPGTVLEFGGDQEVTVAKEESNKVVGVVSSEPAYVMNGNLQAEFPAMVALIGRVPVRVIGYVSKGDMLISAGNGLAKATILAPKIGTVIGKAIQNKWSDGEGTVEVLVGRL